MNKLNLTMVLSAAVFFMGCANNPEPQVGSSNDEGSGGSSETQDPGHGDEGGGGSAPSMPNEGGSDGAGGSEPEAPVKMNSCWLSETKCIEFPADWPQKNCDDSQHHEGACPAALGDNELFGCCTTPDAPAATCFYEEVEQSLINDCSGYINKWVSADAI